ncbi:hypothetical protein [Xanthobacter pseudotagetidis]|uniref:hypothetical protein n=1 Tax=Xanthobacter pseudotagetidis TaxID=3119911 RepID=UPI003726844B
MQHIAARCRDLQGQMLEWSSGHRAPDRALYDGTVRSLVRRYQLDPESPYHDLRPRSRAFYDYGLGLLDKHVGESDLSEVSGPDVRRWYKKLKEPAKDGGPERVRRAYGAIQMLRVIVNYGRTLKLAECRDLADALSAMEFKGVQRRESRMTYAQVRAFREHAHSLGRPSMALGITLQFDLGMRQRDVIGEWLPDATPGDSGIVAEGMRWADGLTFSHITGTVLRKRTSKTGKVVEHDLAQLPDTLAEMEHIPALKRIGPLVVNEETGLPYKRRVYVKWFRTIARAAGIPDEVWSMDARAGAVTEALDARAMPLDVMNAAGHTQLSTTQGYDRSMVQKTARVAKLRVASRKNEAENADMGAGI